MWGSVWLGFASATVVVEGRGGDGDGACVRG